MCLSDKMGLDVSADPFRCDVLAHDRIKVLSLSDKMRSDVSAGRAFLII